MVEHEDPEAVFVAELLLDPRVASAPDLPLVQVELGGVHGDDGGAVQPLDRVALAEQLLEVHVADVARVVVAQDEQPVRAISSRYSRAYVYSSWTPNVVRCPYTRQSRAPGR